jgi:hypothetical protein
MEKILMLQNLGGATDVTLAAGSQQSAECSTRSWAFCTSNNEVQVTSSGS